MKKLKHKKAVHRKTVAPRKGTLIVVVFSLLLAIFVGVRLYQTHPSVLAIQMMPAQQGVSAPTTTSPTPTSPINMQPAQQVTATPTPAGSQPAQQVTPTPTITFFRMPAQQAPTATPTVQPPTPTTAPTPTPSGPGAPVQGYGFYEGCDPYLGQSCLDRLAKMANSGFRLVLNYGQLSGSAQDITNYLDTANSLGLKVIFAMNNHVLWDGTNLFTHYTGLAKTCKTPSGTACTTNKDMLTYIVLLVKNNPALWGYYVGDELEQYYAKEQNFFATWTNYSNFIHSLDSAHPRLVMEGTRSHGYANPYITTFAPYAEVIGQDYYPIGDDVTVPYIQTGAVAKDVQSLINSTGKQSAFALQFQSLQEYYPPARCTPWPSCAPFPNKTQIQKMVYDTLKNAKPQFILFYSYYDLWDSRKYSMIANDYETQQQHWDDLVSVIGSTQPQTTNFPNTIFNSVTNLFTGSTQSTANQTTVFSAITAPFRFVLSLFGIK